MKTNLFFVEGLPAVGKSYHAKQLSDGLISEGKYVKFLKEETSQPIDLFRQAILTFEEGDALIEKAVKLCETESAPSFEQFHIEYAKHSYTAFHKTIIAYTQLSFDYPPLDELMKSLRRFDLGEGRVSFNVYADYHYTLADNFVNNVMVPNCFYVSEGAFLHNQLFDIIGFYELQDKEIIDYFRNLWEIYRPLSPQIHFICVSDIQRLISQALIERGTSEGTWGYGLSAWMEHSAYGKKHMLRGQTGMLCVYNHLSSLYQMIIECINADCKYFIRPL